MTTASKTPREGIVSDEEKVQKARNRLYCPRCHGTVPILYGHYKGRFCVYCGSSFDEYKPIKEDELPFWHRPAWPELVEDLVRNDILEGCNDENIIQEVIKYCSKHAEENIERLDDPWLVADDDEIIYTLGNILDFGHSFHDGIKTGIQMVKRNGKKRQA